MTYNEKKELEKVYEVKKAELEKVLHRLEELTKYDDIYETFKALGDIYITSKQGLLDAGLTECEARQVVTMCINNAL